MVFSRLVAAVVVTLLGPGAGDPEEAVVVETSLGAVRGERRATDSGKMVDVWASIPFAEPPVGKLRFLPPVAAKPWSGVKDVRKVANSCVQIKGTAFGNFSGEQVWVANSPLSEDCLYLQVARPVSRRMERIPVMVWIYGGSFYSGTISLDLYDPGVLAAENNVMVVSVQYRVASLGFLYLGAHTDPHSYSVGGNAGLLDQVLALRWIKQNIIMFGGDPDRITLFSESAGSTSAGYHMLSPLSRGLFNRVILQSASPLSPWGHVTTKEAKRRSLRLAMKLGCPVTQGGLQPDKDTLKCLQRVDPIRMVNTEWDPAGGGPLVYGICGMPFVPITDGEFLPDDPQRLIQAGDFQKTEVLLGANTDEGTYFLIYFLTHLFKLKDNITISAEEYDKSVAEVNHRVKPIGLAGIKFVYTDWMAPHTQHNYVTSLDRMVGDYQFTCPVLEFAQQLAESPDYNKKIFLYHFGHRTASSPWPPWAGVMHGDEIAYVFGDPLRDQPAGGGRYTEEERQLSRDMMAHWTNFAKTGDPNKNEDGSWVPADSGTFWPVYSATAREFLSISARNYSAGAGLRAQQCHFWTTYLRQLLREAEEPPAPPKVSSQDICAASSEDCNCVQRVQSSPSSCSCTASPSPSALVLPSLLSVMLFLILIATVL